MRQLSNDKKHIDTVLMVSAIFFALIIGYLWALHNEITTGPGVSAITGNGQSLYISPGKFFFVRLIFLVILGFSSYMNRSTWIRGVLKKENMKAYWIAYALVCMALLMGMTGLRFYDLYIFPFVLLSSMYLSAVCFSSINKNSLEEEDILGGASNREETEFSFTFSVRTALDGKPGKSKEKKLTVHNPFQGIFIEGGAGSGKSASLVEPIICQAVEKGFSGVVYDFKGNPPTLGKLVYNSIMHYHSRGVKTSNFAMINFTDPVNSVKSNPLNPVYLTTRLHANEAAEILMLNLNRSWIEKKDFWADNAILAIQGMIWFLKKHYPHLCTVPHLISLALRPYDQVFRMLENDHEIKSLMQPLLTPWKLKADNQIAGAVSSYQISLTKLYTPEIFYLLNPKKSEEFSFDVSDPGAPAMLALCNDPDIQESVSPIISLMLSVIMKNINQQGKNKSLFCVDELPTIYIKKLEGLPATARSNKVVTCVAIQDFSQLEKYFGNKESEMIISNLGNQFTGMTNNQKTAKRVSDLFGQVKKLDISYSESESSLSTSERLQKTEAMPPRDVSSQQVGHFSGKIAGGKPPFFSAQFSQYSFPFENGNIPTLRKTRTETIRKEIEENWEQIASQIDLLLEPYIAEEP